jgi:ribosome-associated protein
MPSSGAGGNGRYNPGMSDDIVVTESVRVPARAVTVRAVRASGPGGQNVNKVATKIDLRVDLEAIEGLSEPARARLRTLATHRLDGEGRLAVTSQATRNQARNLEAARGKVVDLVRAALVRPRPRVSTRPSVASGERRLAAKKRRGTLKSWRARPGED